jgi:site-specific DNA recombinase
VTGSVTDAGHLPKRERCTLRQVHLALSLEFLPPQLVKAAVEGRLPRGTNIERLRNSHPEWSRQFEELGLDIGHLDRAGSGLHDGSDAGAGTDLRSRPSTRTV